MIVVYILMGALALLVTVLFAGFVGCTPFSGTAVPNPEPPPAPATPPPGSGNPPGSGTPLPDLVPTATGSSEPMISWPIGGWVIRPR